MVQRLISAPTGSGKTTIFDLAFLRMLHAETQPVENDTRTTYAIYLAPTKVSLAYHITKLTTRLSAASDVEIGMSDSKISVIATPLVLVAVG
jgi:replicative superfamily II helicase